MSRPRLSVPSRKWWCPGPTGRPSTVSPVSWNWSLGPCPVRWATSGASTANATSSTIITEATIAVLSLRSRAQASCQGLRPSTASTGPAADGVTCARSVTLMSAPPSLFAAALRSPSCSCCSPGIPLGDGRRRFGLLLDLRLGDGRVGAGQVIALLDWEVAGSGVLRGVAVAGDQRGLLGDAALPRLGA